MGRGNGQRQRRFYHIGFYHDGYVYIIQDEYGPVLKVKAKSTAEFENFEAEWKAWASSGYSEQLGEKSYAALRKMFSGYNAFSASSSEKKYDFQEEKRRLQNEKPRPAPSLMNAPQRTDSHPPRIARVYIENDNVITEWDYGTKISLPL
jgi:hypothetical protein